MTQQPIVNEKDRRIGIISSILLLLLLFLYLKFTSFLIADPPPKDIPLATIVELPLEITLKELKIEGGGSGTPTEAPIQKEFQAQTQHVITKEDSKTTEKTGKSNHSTAQHDPNAGASTTENAPNYFGGSGGSGGGDQGGKGKGFGTDTGDGIGPGNNGGKKARIRLNEPNTDGIQSDQNCKIHLKLSVNAEGNVVKAENIVAKTTTVNQILINQVKSNVLSHVKYNKVEGAAIEIQFLTVNLLAK